MLDFLGWFNSLISFLPDEFLEKNILLKQNISYLVYENSSLSLHCLCFFIASTINECHLYCGKNYMEKNDKAPYRTNGLLK